MPALLVELVSFEQLDEALACLASALPGLGLEDRGLAWVTIDRLLEQRFELACLGER